MKTLPPVLKEEAKQKEGTNKYSNQYEARTAILESRRRTKIRLCFAISFLFLLGSTTMFIFMNHREQFKTSFSPPTYLWNTAKQEGMSCRNTIQGKQYITDERGTKFRLIVQY